MLRLLTVLLVSGSFAISAFGGSPDPKSLAIPPEELVKARDLVQQLGNEQFFEREDAHKRLARMGRFAHAAILDAANYDPSAEIRSRCRALLPQAIALDIKARLDVFLADADGKYEHDLPGWNQFRAAVREDWSLFGYTVWTDRTFNISARTVFAELISAPDNREVVMAIGRSQTDLGQIVAARRLELCSARNRQNVVIIAGGQRIEPAAPGRALTAADIAALLLAESQVPEKFVPRATSIGVLLTTPAFVSRVQVRDDKGKVYRSILTAWLESRQDPIDMYQAINLAQTLKLPDQLCRAAARLLSMQGAQVAYRGIAANMLAKHGTKSHLPLLEKALADESVLIAVQDFGPGIPVKERKQHDLQVRDAALAISIVIAGLSLDDYGFSDTQKGRGAINGNYGYSRYYLTDDKRQAAFEKWKEWRDKNP